MQNRSLTELINDVEQEMWRLGCAKTSMKFYRKRWQRLLRFAQEQGELFYTERLGINFVEKHFHILCNLNVLSTMI